MPRLIGAVLTLKAATMAELNTVLSIQDCYDLLEVAAIDAHNRAVIAPKRPRA